MKLKTETAPHAAGSAAFLFAHQRPIGSPRIMLEAPNDGGTGGDDEAAKAAAAEAARVKELEDKAAKEAADKAAADEAAAAEAARKVQEDLEKKQKDGTLSDTEAVLLKQVMKHKKAAKEAADKLKQYEGVDPEEHKRLKEAADKAAEAQRKAEVEAAEKAGDFERVKKMMAEQAQKDVEAARNEGKTAKDALDQALKTIDDLTVGQSFGMSKFVGEELVLTPAIARQVFGGHFELDENKQIIGYDKPKGAKERTMLVDAQGEPLAFDAALQKLVEKSPDKDRLLRSKLAPGAHSRSEPGTRATREQVKTGDDGEPKGLARIQAALAAGGLKKK